MDINQNDTLIRLKTTDNCQENNRIGWSLDKCMALHNCTDDIAEEVAKDLSVISGKQLSLLQKENPDLLIFPYCLGAHHDDVDKLCICSYDVDDRRLYTGNLMGFVGINHTQLSITSRFAKDEEDHFLHYMLMKVFCPNIVKLSHESHKSSSFDFMLYLFPYYFNMAMQQGLYKEYRRFEHNDTDVKGTIDINRHIQTNIPFIGNIAYNTREYAYNNRITQLIRHTIEYIRKSDIGRQILSDKETLSHIRTIVDKTPNYSIGQRRKVINENIREIRHPYLTHYTALQRLCLSILRHEELKYGSANNKVHGIMFDGTWLWEEYLNTIFKTWGINHAENKTGKNPCHLFVDGSYVRYPDFYIKNEIVIDAKFKHLDNNDMSRDDLHQIITYLHILNAKHTFVAYPIDVETKNTYVSFIGTLNGMGGKIGRIGLKIPQRCKDIHSFINEIEYEVQENLLPMRKKIFDSSH